jgi:hypothetical protein
VRKFPKLKSRNFKPYRATRKSVCPVCRHSFQSVYAHRRSNAVFVQGDRPMCLFVPGFEIPRF